MEYLEFERILSAKRMQRYKDAANGDTRKAMALYRYNLRLSQEMFTIVSCLTGQGTGTCPCATRCTSIYKGLATFHIRCSRNCQ